MEVEIVGKKQIAEAIHEQLDTGFEEARQLLDHYLDALKEALSQGNKIPLAGIATIAGGDESSTVDQEAMSARLAERGGIDVGRAQGVIGVILEYLKPRLLSGSEIQLTDFATFSVIEKKARIIRDPKSGQNLIAPTRMSLFFEPSESLRLASAGQRISFVPSLEIQEHLARIKTASILIICPKIDFFVQTIEYHFQKSGWKVELASSEEEAREKLSGDETYLIMMDTNVSYAEAISEIVKCRKDTSLIPLILMHPKGTDVKHPAGFRICGDEQVIEPFEVRSLLTLAETELARSSEEEAIFLQEVSFQLPTEDESIDRANDMGKKLFEGSGLEEKDQVALCAAFREALGNAAQHGNKYRRDKPLEVLYLLDREKITIAVTDSGDGFGHQNYLTLGQTGNVLDAARESHRKGQLGGLGIMLMLKCVDRLEYNERGNVLTLTKYIHPEAVSGQVGAAS